jgi:hypothetical protein
LWKLVAELSLAVAIGMILVLSFGWEMGEVDLYSKT